MTTATDPQAEAQALLRACSGEELLTKAYALTHRIHEAEANKVRARGIGHTRTACAEAMHAADLREQRDLITAELIRRIGA